MSGVEGRAYGNDAPLPAKVAHPTSAVQNAMMATAMGSPSPQRSSREAKLRAGLAIPFGAAQRNKAAINALVTQSEHSEHSVQNTGHTHRAATTCIRAIFLVVVVEPPRLAVATRWCVPRVS